MIAHGGKPGYVTRPVFLQRTLFSPAKPRNPWETSYEPANVIPETNNLIDDPRVKISVPMKKPAFKNALQGGGPRRTGDLPSPRSVP